MLTRLASRCTAVGSRRVTPGTLGPPQPAAPGREVTLWTAEQAVDQRAAGWDFGLCPPGRFLSMVDSGLAALPVRPSGRRRSSGQSSAGTTTMPSRPIPA